MIITQNDYETCPICDSELILRQINFETAVFMCKDFHCPYPDGHGWIFQERDIETLIQVYDYNSDEIHQEVLADIEWFNDFDSEDEDMDLENLQEIYDEIAKDIENLTDTDDENAETLSYELPFIE